MVLPGLLEFPLRKEFLGTPKRQTTRIVGAVKALIRPGTEPAERTKLFRNLGELGFRHRHYAGHQRY